MTDPFPEPAAGFSMPLAEPGRYETPCLVTVPVLQRAAPQVP
jgi:hypothetical protein